MTKPVGRRVWTYTAKRTSIEYEYDAIGNMTRDKNKEIREIRYNMLNLPEEIIIENGNRIKYYYDAGGTKR